jgi:UDP-glucuronate decarboxylase
MKLKNILITGGAGFVGSNLVNFLINQGHTIIVLDNLCTGSKKNIKHLINNTKFYFFQHDVTEPFIIPFNIKIDEIYHLACMASPPKYQAYPVKTLETCFLGTLNMLKLAEIHKSKILLASTSEIYGDPNINPQTENYFGNVNTVGPRSCYDEGKRISETLFYEYNKKGVKTRIARIFNTFGPNMDSQDGRVVSNFILQCIKNEDITIYGDGTITRSFQYIDDLINGLVLLMESECTTPINIGNPDEYSINDFALLIKKLTNSSNNIIYLKEAEDDPKKRKPDITKAQNILNWQPKISVIEGLLKTIQYFNNMDS